ncbi:FkbM family methyltransferase [Actibacterium sp. 188UL27-1]|uniref:FkbM family methyltransferase n=1 Tax=Actibacterium sp. 188UL27-1 TaxID=2786961 RepID=UPI00195DFC8F|nr:FkbM family methyltransferase [Actibacterium sp. 188UL27-1]MBM7070040.1 FkbM family methyltransferase [Actibacterium sp. 188UL27-1]
MQILTNDGVKFQTSGDLETYRVNSLLTKEPETIYWLNRYTDREYTFLDVGANIGIYACYFAAKSPRGRTIAFEPEPKNFRALVTNLSLNSEMAWALPFGVGAQSGEVHLSVPDSRIGNSGAQISDPISSDSELNTIPVISLDDFLALYPARTPMILKIDIDGRESDVIKGAQKALVSGQIESLLIEFDNADQECQVDETFLPLGYVPDDAVNSLSTHSTKRRAAKGSTIRNKVYSYAP